MERIHVVGCGPRSGTTLITEMLIACFEIDLHTYHENSIFTWPWHWGHVFVTKKPRDVILVEEVLASMQNLHVIFMLRDPRDMIVSRHGRTPDKYWCGLEFWKAYKPFADRLRMHPRFITVRYEDLVTQPDTIQKQLMEQMPFLRKKTLFSQFNELAQPSKASELALGGTRTVSTDSIGNWRNHLPRVAGQIRIHGSLTKDLIDFGYEKDALWEQELQGIEPDMTPSHWPEFFSERTVEKWQKGLKWKARLIRLGHTKPMVFVNMIRTQCKSKLK